MIRPIHLLLAMPPGFRAAFLFLVLAGCASGPPKLPYPAFIQADELEDVFLASLPGVRAKQFSGDPQTRRSTNRINLPPGWQGTTGGAPGKLLEMFVLKGDLTVSDLSFGPGGYVHVPPGTYGFNLKTAEGAQILYYLDDVDPMAIIQTPTLLDSGLLDWEPTDMDGVAVKILRSDPGNGARTWMMRVSKGASIPWRSTSVTREGYLMSGQYQHSECVAGEPQTWTYTTGGYFLRPSGAINGGPESMALTESVWVLRERMAGAERAANACRQQPGPSSSNQN